MMLPYTKAPASFLDAGGFSIASFISSSDYNIDLETIESFGEEWTRFSRFTDDEIEIAGRQYFDIVLPEMLGSDKYVLDIGCGMGRWTYYLASKVGFIEAIDPSMSALVAGRVNRNISNVRVTQAGVDMIPFPDNSFDFVFSLGVMHHLPDTRLAISKAASKLKSGGYFLVYLYYNLDNRGAVYKFLFYVSDLIRRLICRLPYRLKNNVCDLIATVIYFPTSRLVALFLKIFPGATFINKLPLSYYKDKSFRIMRNDALDRFGTPLENRFSKSSINDMLIESGFVDIVFSCSEPFWHAVAKKT